MSKSATIGRLLDALEGYRIVMGSILSVLLLAVGGMLIYIDAHPAAVQRSTVTKVLAQSQPASISKPASSTGSQSNVGILNINTATASQLDGLSGIGAAYAARIVAYRTEHGLFKTTHDIVNIKGIGEKTYDAIKDNITVGGE